MSIRSIAALAILGLLAAGGLLRAAEDPEDAYQSLFGDEAKRVLLANNSGEIAQLARKVLDAARRSGDDHEFQAFLCQKAYDLGGKVQAGYETAIDSLKFLADTDPNRRTACFDKATAIYQKWMTAARGEERHRVVDSYYRYLQDSGDGAARTGDWAMASKFYKSLQTLTETNRPSRKEEAAARVAVAAGMEQAAARLDLARKKLQSSPADSVQARIAMRICMIDFDDPNAAIPFAEAAGEQQAVAFLLLAVKPVVDLPVDDCLGLGDWYRTQAANAAPLAKPLMLRRATAYYQRFLSLHRAADRETARAKVALEQAKGDLDKSALLADTLKQVLGGAKGASSTTTSAPAEYVPPPAVVEFARKRDALPPAEQVQLLRDKFKELNGAQNFDMHPRIEGDHVVDLYFKGGREISTLEPLWGMKLRSLTVRECSKVQNLNGIQGMPLETLTLWSIPLVRGDLSELKGMKLRRLEVMGSDMLTGISGIKDMPLEELTVSWCKNLRMDLGVLKGMAIRKLRLEASSDLGNLDGIRDLPIQELSLSRNGEVRGDLTLLKNMKDLRSLSLDGCERLTSLDGIQDLPLERLDIRECESLRDLLPLKGKKLRELSLKKCTNLTSVNGIQDCLITVLNLEGCKNLRGDLTTLKGMNINNLSLRGCENLGGLAGIADLPVNDLDLDGCPVVKTDLGLLKGLKNLRRLSIGGTGVTSLSVLSGMTSIQSLSASGCKSLTGDLSALKGMKDLTWLNLENCENLTSLTGIFELHLKEITVQGCKKLPLAEVQRLKEIRSLEHVRTGDAKLDAQIVAGKKGG